MPEPRHPAIWASGQIGTTTEQVARSARILVRTSARLVRHRLGQVNTFVYIRKSSPISMIGDQRLPQRDDHGRRQAKGENPYGEHKAHGQGFVQNGGHLRANGERSERCEGTSSENAE
jgi:hypothetical protein